MSAFREVVSLVALMVGMQVAEALAPLSIRCPGCALCGGRR